MKKKMFLAVFGFALFVIITICFAVDYPDLESPGAAQVNIEKNKITLENQVLALCFRIENNHLKFHNLIDKKNQHKFQESKNEFFAITLNNGQPFDGNIRYDSTWVEDSTGTNSSEYATGNNVIEFLIPLQSSDPQDIGMFPGMNYQLKFLWWNNKNHGEPSFASGWNTFWVPIQLY